MALDLIIENCVLVIPKIGLVKGCLGIEAGKVAGIYGSAAGLTARDGRPGLNALRFGRFSLARRLHSLPGGRGALTRTAAPVIFRPCG